MKKIGDEVYPAFGNLTHTVVNRPAFLALDKRQQVARLAKIPNESQRKRFESVYRNGLDAQIVKGSIKKIANLLIDMETVLENS